MLAGLAAVIRWGGEPEPALPTRLERELAISVAAGLGAGVLAAGAGGRLVMRLLALTSPSVQGSITEAGETVGHVTAGGTLRFVVASAVFLGIASGIVHGLVRRLLPRGRAGGLAYGALLLLVAGTRAEPLRADNPDFTLLGPTWLAVTAFSAVVVFHGMVLAALAARLRRAFPRAAAPSGRWTPAIPRAALVAVVVLAVPGSAASVAEILGAR